MMTSAFAFGFDGDDIDITNDAYNSTQNQQPPAPVPSTSLTTEPSLVPESHKLDSLVISLGSNLTSACSTS